MMSITDTGKIIDKAVSDYAVSDTPEKRAQIRLIWNAWSGVAKQVGKYDPANAAIAKAFRQSLSEKTTIPTLTIAPIASAIFDLGESGVLDQKYINPQGFSAIQSANTEAIKATGGGLFDKILSPLETVKENAGWIKWGVIGVGTIALLWVGLPYLKAGTAAAKTLSSKFKRKENPDDSEDEE